MKAATFRKQTSTPSSPSDVDTVEVFANSSGILTAVNSAGTTFQVGAQTSNSMAMLGQSVTTGFGFLKNNTANTYTGLFVGSTGTYTATTFLGAPYTYLAFTGPSGESLAVPAYLRA